jgi:hypothetical protein
MSTFPLSSKYATEAILVAYRWSCCCCWYNVDASCCVCWSTILAYCCCTEMDEIGCDINISVLVVATKSVCGLHTHIKLFEYMSTCLILSITATSKATVFVCAHSRCRKMNWQHGQKAFTTFTQLLVGYKHVQQSKLSVQYLLWKMSLMQIWHVSNKFSIQNIVLLTYENCIVLSHTIHQWNDTQFTTHKSNNIGTHAQYMKIMWNVQAIDAGR